MQEKVPFSQVIVTAFLITGGLVGAGILALPVNTGLAGFVPSLVGMAVIGGAMFFTAVVLGYEATLTREATFNFPSLYGNYLGSTGKWIAIFANLLILYGLLTAYLTGATSITASLFGLSSLKPVVMVVFSLGLSALTVAGVSIVAKYNALLTVMMLTAFTAIVLMAEGHVQVQRMTYTDWSFLPSTAPIVVCAFYFHNIIPTVCRSMKWNHSVVWKTILIGMLLGFAMNALWIQASVGALPLKGGDVSLFSAFEKSLPATVPLSEVIGSHIFTIAALLFSLLAITTSYLALGVGFMGFIQDLMVNHVKKSHRALNIAICFAPPLLISLVYPGIFLKAMNIVGGVGIVVLFGILPSIIYLMRVRSFPDKSSRPGQVGMLALGGAIMLLFGAFLVLELAQEFGLLHISPGVEHWTAGVVHR
ncbi:aromatic amino acid transport family protein [Verrucomicrobiota bacterium]